MPFTKTPMTPEERKQRKQEASLRHYHAHKEACRASQNARRAENRDEVRADARARRKADPERYQAYGRKEQLRRRQRMPWLASFHACRKRAIKRGLEFTLTYEWAQQIYTGRCAVTGVEFDVRAVAGKPGPTSKSVSIDRIDQTKGYTPENCRFILNAVNNFRGTSGDGDMVTIARALLNKNSLTDPPL